MTGACFDHVKRITRCSEFRVHSSYKFPKTPICQTCRVNLIDTMDFQLVHGVRNLKDYKSLYRKFGAKTGLGSDFHTLFLVLQFESPTKVVES